MGTGCHSSSGRQQVAACEAFCLSHGEQDGGRLALCTGTSMGLCHDMAGHPGICEGRPFWAMGEHGETQNYVYQGMPRVEVKWQCSREYDERSGRTVMIPSRDQTFPSSLPSPAYTWWSCRAPQWRFYRASKGTPGVGAGEAAPIASTNADCLLQISYSFPTPTLAFSKFCPFIIPGQNFFYRFVNPNLHDSRFFKWTLPSSAWCFHCQYKDDSVYLKGKLK